MATTIIAQPPVLMPAYNPIKYIIDNTNKNEPGFYWFIIFNVKESHHLPLFISLIGNSGSANFDNNFTYTGSYLNTIPRKDLLAESYKRIYHNLPLLLKTKGTAYGLQTLISTSDD